MEKAGEIKNKGRFLQRAAQCDEGTFVKPLLRYFASGLLNLTLLSRKCIIDYQEDQTLSVSIIFFTFVDLLCCCVLEENINKILLVPRKNSAQYIGNSILFLSFNAPSIIHDHNILDLLGPHPLGTDPQLLNKSHVLSCFTSMGQRIG